MSPAQDRRGKLVSETDGSAWSHHSPQRTWAQHCQQALSVNIRECVTLSQYLCRMLGDGINHLSHLEEKTFFARCHGAFSTRCRCAYSARCHGTYSARCCDAYPVTWCILCQILRCILCQILWCITAYSARCHGAYYSRFHGAYSDRCHGTRQLLN